MNKEALIDGLCPSPHQVRQARDQEQSYAFKIENGRELQSYNYQVWDYCSY